jgi:hypothetical protein
MEGGGNRRSIDIVLMPLRHPPTQCVHGAYLLKTCHGTDHRRLPLRSPHPVHHDIDLFALAWQRHHHALDQLPNDCLTVGHGGAAGVPQRRNILGQPPDRLALRG